MNIFRSISEPSDARVKGHEEHPEQAGRVHGVFLPRLHLRPQPVSAHQPALGKGRHQEEAPAAAPLQVQQQQVSDIAHFASNTTRNKLSTQLMQHCEEHHLKNKFISDNFMISDNSKE
ncbi:hypothetical protein AVEN_120823-1 [Araneus ventricosus]|uniref:Uncharacterized protein n=1 Tax=Araneus ventricosus TaxID=182803 RepID=A0A4Y2FG26_ARAVE|nr:hypothetical protein AVEN_120823-1 [Araneus ventricosus]